MRDALLRIGSFYKEATGTSKILILFIISIATLILIDENDDTNIRRRRVNPTVFLLSLWSAVSYAIVRVLSGKKKLIIAVGLLFSFIAIALSGGFVVSDEAYKLSIYYYTNSTVTILSVICILFYFIIYYMISRQLFNLKADRATFMGVVFVLHLFDFYSEMAAKFSIFLSPLSISSVVIHDVMPLLLWLYLVYEDRVKEYFAGEETTDVTDTDDYMEEWDMKKHKILNMRNMAIAFLVMLIAFAASVFVLNNKINSLYDATVVLENAANTKMSIYELKGEDGKVKLTLMISPDKTATVYGGIGDENGTEAFDLIKKYTDKVDKWYLYGDDSENKSVYDFCIDRGLKVNETFIISGIEQID